MRKSRRNALRTIAPVAVVIGLIGALSGCGSPDITRARLEASLPVVFTNLYLQQQADIGRHQLTKAMINTQHPACDRGGPTVKDVGAGSDWICVMDFTNGVGVLQSKSKFEIKINSNGCYTAGASTRVVGPATIPTPSGKFITNKVFEFDGCFDTTN